MTSARARRFAIMVVTAGIFSYFAACVCNALIELQQAEPLTFFFTHTLYRSAPAFVIGSALVWAVVLLLWAVTARLFWSIGIVAALCAVVGFANHVKLQARQEPLYLSDLQFAGQGGFLADMVGPVEIVEILVLALVLLLGVVLLGRRVRRVYPDIDPRTTPRAWRGMVLVRVLATVTALAVLLPATRFNDDGNPIRETYEASGVHWAFWFQKLNYERNGFVGGVLYNLPVSPMVEPPGYDRATMQRVVQRWRARAAELNRGRQDTLADYNVVTVLSEAFSDPTQVKGVDVSLDPIPRTRRLMEQTPSGTMLAQLFGGGTANMEFELLTSESLALFRPQVNAPFQQVIPRDDSFPSVVGLFRQEGRPRVAIHPYMTTMYHREEVYPILGFQRFIGEDQIADPERIQDSQFISDATAFDEVEKVLHAEQQPSYVHLVTMQNHWPMRDEYDDPVPVSGLSGSSKDDAEGYVRGLTYTDKALVAFLARLKASGEKTVVLFFGDHQPAIYPTEITQLNGFKAMHSTPFFVWSTDGLAPRDYPITSPVYFMPILFDLMGEPLTPYYALLHDLRAQVPAMDQGMFFDPGGRPHDLDQLPPRAQQLLSDLRLLQYDVTVGHRWASDAMFYPGASGSSPVSAGAAPARD